MRWASTENLWNVWHLKMQLTFISKQWLLRSCPATQTRGKATTCKCIKRTNLLLYNNKFNINLQVLSNPSPHNQLLTISSQEGLWAIKIQQAKEALNSLTANRLTVMVYSYNSMVEVQNQRLTANLLPHLIIPFLQLQLAVPPQVSSKINTGEW